MFRSIILVGLGGGIGCILRYLTSVAVSRYFQGAFPLATFFANMVGCVLIGLLIGLLSRLPESAPSDLRLLLITGFCGGYTTFSAFAAENIRLLQTGQTATALLYIFSSVAVSLFAVWIGLSLAQRII